MKLSDWKNWLEQTHPDDLVTDLFGAHAVDVQQWITQKYDPGERPEIMYKGTHYDVIGEPDMPDAKGKFIQIRHKGLRHSGGNKLVPVDELMAAVRED